MERETGLEPATTCLEGRSSSQLSYSRKMVVREGFEPSKVKTSRFTVCPRWPLEYLTLTIMHYYIWLNTASKWSW